MISNKGKAAKAISTKGKAAKAISSKWKAASWLASQLKTRGQSRLPYCWGMWPIRDRKC
jgi:hypothetical protein